MFLTYWGNHLDELEKPLTASPVVNEELTRKWQRLASGICVKDEVNALRILSWKETAGDTWLGIGMWTSPGEAMTQLLVVAQVGGKVYTNWDALPADVQQRFQTARGKGQPSDVLFRKLLDDIRGRGLSSTRP